MEIQEQEVMKVKNLEQKSGGNQSTIRSYECTFCKRGFTNAQALGGHMNIHRKEKAKLKQSTSAAAPSSSSFSSNNNKMVVDTPKMISTPARFPWIKGHVRSGGGENTNLTILLEETLICEVRQLPLFVEKPSNMDRDQLEIDHQVLSSNHVANSDQKIGSSFRQDSAVFEMDLELRLGPEPPSSNPSSFSPYR